MAYQDRYKVSIYYGDSLIESIVIVTDNYPLVYRLASLYFNDDVHCTKCYVEWRDVVLAEFTDNSRLNSVQQIPQSL